MHRGSSNGTGGPTPLPGSLPLSASPSVEVIVELVRGASVDRRVARVAADASVRTALRAVGLFGEGSAVLDGGRPLPLDTPVGAARTLTVVPTFSGG